MKATKVLFLSLMCILLSAATVLWQVSSAMNATALSPHAYKAVISEIDLPGLINEYNPDTANPNGVNPEKNREVQELKKILIKSLDQNWVKKQAGILIDGIFANLEGNAKTLPVIDLTGFKEKMINTVVEDEILKQGTGKAKTNPAKIRSRMEKELGLPDAINLNDFLKIPADQREILLANVQTVYRGIKNLPLLALTIICLIVLAVAAAAFAPNRACKWLGSSFLCSGLLVLASAILLSAAAVPDSVQNAVQKSVLVPLGAGFAGSAAKQAVCVISLGIVLLSVGFLPIVRKKSETLMTWLETSDKRKTVYRARVIAVVVFLLLIPASAAIYTAPVAKAAFVLTGH